MMTAMAEMNSNQGDRRTIEVTGPGQKDTHSSKWERQEQLVRVPATNNTTETAKALQVKRWTVSDEPFQGFNSPPGRF